MINEKFFKEWLSQHPDANQDQLKENIKRIKKVIISNRFLLLRTYIFRTWQLDCLAGNVSETSLGRLADKKDAFGRSLLFYLALSSPEFFLNKAEYIDFFPNESAFNENIVHWALLGGNISFIGLLINKYPVLVQKKDNEGRNLLHYAAWSGNPETIAWIIARYPQMMESTDNHARSFLHYAAWSGNPNAIAWVITNHPKMAENKDGTDRNLLYYAALSGNPETIAYVIEKYPGIAESRDNYGDNLLYYAALSGNPETIAYVIEKYPGIAESRDNYGDNLLHFAAWSGNTEAIAYVIEKYPGMAESRDNEGRNLLHYAAWSGNPEAIAWVIARYPQMMESIDNSARSFLHYAAWSGNPEAIAYVIEKYPGMVESKDNEGRNLLHFAAWSGNTEAISRVIAKYPELARCTDIKSRNLLHFAADSGNPEAIAWVIAKYPEMVESRDNTGHNFLYYAAESGNPNAIAWILAKYPEMAENKDREERNILHFAAVSGNPEAIEWVLANYPELMESIARDGRNLLHYVAESGNPQAIEWVFTNLPDVSKKFYTIRNNNGDTPDALASKAGFQRGVTCTLQKLIEQNINRLKANTEGVAFSQAKNFLRVFSDEVLEWLANKENDAPGYIANFGDKLNIVCSGKPLKNKLEFLLELSENNKIICNQYLDAPKLEKLYNLLRNVLRESPANAKNRPMYGFCFRLFCILRAPVENTNALSNEQLTLLNAYIQQFRNYMAGEHSENDTENLFGRAVDILLTSNQLSSINIKKIELSEGMTISEDHHKTYLNEMKQSLASVIIDSETKRIAGNVIDALLHIAEHKDEISEFHENNFGRLYDMPHNIPLHTDHVEIANAMEYRKTLIRLLDNLIGAFCLAKTYGKQAVFFEKLSPGFCLEGRSRACLTWAGSLHALQSVDEIMAAALKQYQSYMTLLLSGLPEIVSKNISEYFSLSHAAEYINQHFGHKECQTNSEHAPDGRLTLKSIKKYLENILYLTDDCPPPPLIDCRVKLLHYLFALEFRADENYLYSFFGLWKAGFSAGVKRAAANALLNFANGADPETLKPHMPALNNGRLGRIYEKFRSTSCRALQDISQTAEDSSLCSG